MNRYNRNIHHRKSIRLKGYNYAQAGLYFITICCQGRICRFGDVENGKMIVNDAGKMVGKWYDELPNKFPDIRCHEMVVMPNHFHCIIEIVDNVGNVGADLRVCPHNEIADVDFNIAIGNIGNEPIGTQTSLGEPIGTQTSLGEHTGTQPPLGEPVGTQPSLGEPIGTQTSLGEHTGTQPSLGEPTGTQPSLGEPTGTQPSLGEHAGSQSSLGEHAGSQTPLGKPTGTQTPLGKPTGTRTPLGEPTGTQISLGEHAGSPLHRVVQWFKTMTTNAYIRGVKTLGWPPFDGKLWQRNYYEHIICNKNSYQNISQYIINNPAKWVDDKFYIK